jgi:hypothetical protein
VQAEATPPVLVPLQFKDVHGSPDAAAEDSRYRLVPLVDREAVGLGVREEPILERSSKFRCWPHPKLIVALHGRRTLVASFSPDSVDACALPRCRGVMFTLLAYSLYHFARTKLD